MLDLATGMQMAVTVTEVHLRPPFKKEPAIQLQKAVSWKPLAVSIFRVSFNI